MKRAGLILLALTLCLVSSCARKQATLSPDTLKKVAVLADRGDLDSARERLELLNKNAPFHPQTLMAYRDLVTMLIDQGKQNEAKSVFEEARQILNEVDPNTDPLVPVVLNDIASQAEKMGENDLSMVLLKKAKDGAVHGSSEYALIVGHIGQRLRLDGRYSEALPYLSGAIKASKKGNLQPQEQARLMHDYAETLRAAGMFKESGQVFEEALKIRKSGDPNLYATMLNDYSAYRQDIGDYAGAEKAALEAVKIHREHLAEENPDISRDKINLAEVALFMGRYKEALDLAGSANGNFEENSPDKSSALNIMSHALKELGRLEDSRTAAIKALKIRQESLGQDHPEVAVIMNTYAGSLCALGDYGEAEKILKKAVSIRNSGVTGGDPLMCSLESQQAEILFTGGKKEEAEKLLRKAIGDAEKILGPCHPETTTMRFQLARVLKERGNYEEASALIERVLKERESALGKNHPDYAVALIGKADIMTAEGQEDLAEKELEKASDIREKALGKDDPQMAAILLAKADLLEKKGEYTKALNLVRQAYAARIKMLPKNHPDIVTAIIRIGDIEKRMGKNEEALKAYNRALEKCDKNNEVMIKSIKGRIKNIGDLNA
ncbi:MAG: tetratricopeptide repeat protein [Chloroflexi bacterium]|nr:tetratricopeptide repeat protein [Chloroflexota bacterium]